MPSDLNVFLFNRVLIHENIKKSTPTFLFNITSIMQNSRFHSFYLPSFTLQIKVINEMITIRDTNRVLYVKFRLINGVIIHIKD